ncbi:NmrA-like family protein [Talaromyces proteolyticus]|uniref:NmrA-like family protein n=1 Tax=Talaromyces proteolyticus TaxID=1131652 RepID=A0AAD4KJJ8_9EURO|nr:NmrA-like family protein [Talaromyces proteolyticus]KAH8689986.1 NmrA-like family protein [Talaromyces proteolyticus]
MAERKLGIFPATGGLGGSTVKHLLSLVPASRVILIARNPDKLAAESRLGVVVRRADYDDTATLERVFDGVGALFLISYASCEHEHRSRAHRIAIDAALRSGVTHIFYSSLAFAGNLTSESTALVMQAHLDTEAYLKQLARTRPSFTYTVIREGLYSESFPIYTAFFDPRKPVDEIKIPHDGSGPGVAWAKRDELGEATGKIIATYARNPLGFPYINKTLLLSGAQSLTLAEMVAVLNKILGRDVRIKKVSVDEFAAQPQNAPMLTYHGVDLSKGWATAWTAISQGECSVVTPLLTDMLGREPEDFETTVRRQIEGQQWHELQL